MPDNRKQRLEAIGFEWIGGVGDTSSRLQNDLWEQRYQELIDFKLTKLDGKKISLSDYKDKWLVLETGSLTCPMFVKNINPLRDVRAKHPDVEFLVIYVREAHPGSRRGPTQGLLAQLGRFCAAYPARYRCRASCRSFGEGSFARYVHPSLACVSCLLVAYRSSCLQSYI